MQLEPLERRTLLAGDVGDVAGVLGAAEVAAIADVQIEIDFASQPELNVALLSFKGAEDGGNLVIDVGLLPGEVSEIAISSFDQVALEGGGELRYLTVSDVDKIRLDEISVSDGLLASEVGFISVNQLPTIVSLKGTQSLVSFSSFSEGHVFLSNLQSLILVTDAEVESLFIHSQNTTQSVQISFDPDSLSLSGISSERVEFLSQDVEFPEFTELSAPVDSSLLASEQSVFVIARDEFSSASILAAIRECHMIEATQASGEATEENSVVLDFQVVAIGENEINVFGLRVDGEGVAMMTLSVPSIFAVGFYDGEVSQNAVWIAGSGLIAQVGVPSAGSEDDRILQPSDHEATAVGFEITGLGEPFDTYPVDGVTEFESPSAAQAAETRVEEPTVPRVELGQHPQISSEFVDVDLLNRIQRSLTEWLGQPEGHSYNLSEIFIERINDEFSPGNRPVFAELKAPRFGDLRYPTSHEQYRV